jgi:hypothetical protein
VEEEDGEEAEEEEEDGEDMEEEAEEGEAEEVDEEEDGEPEQRRLQDDRTFLSFVGLTSKSPNSFCK